MPLTIGKNINSLKAQAQLEKSSAALSRVFERLSSGLRINRASDDAAGLSISMGLNSDARTLTVAHQNANDGISLLNVAQSGVQNLSDIVTRLEELATQASNGIFTNTQRRAINTEAQALRDEYTRIVSSTSFNGLNLLDGSNTLLSIQVGLDGSANSQINLTLGSLGTSMVGDGTFGAESFINPGTNTNYFDVGDVNNDGNLDIVANAGTRVFMGNGDGTFKAFVNYTSPYSGTNRGPLLLDLNGDNNLDFVSLTAPLSSIVVTIGNGDGSFKAATSFDVFGTSSGTIIGRDFSGDGRIDLLSVDSNRVFLSVGNGDGTFQAGVSYPLGAALSTAAAGDVDGDGDVDVFVSLAASGRVLLNNGDGTFALGGSYDPGSALISTSLTDLNGDGHLDLVGNSNGGSSVGVVLGNGNGTFKAPTTYTVGALNAGYRQTSTGDLNGDGFADIAVANGVSNTVGVLINNGDGTFKAQATYAATASESSLVVGDFNNDTVLDILTTNTTSNGMSVLLGSATTSSLLPAFNLLTQSSAQRSLTLLSSARESLAQTLGEFGAQASRLEIASKNILTMRNEFITASSRIAEVDVAAEAAEMIRLRILQSSAAAINTQANTDSRLVLNLLKP